MKSLELRQTKAALRVQRRRLRRENGDDAREGIEAINKALRDDEVCEDLGAYFADSVPYTGDVRSWIQKIAQFIAENWQEILSFILLMIIIL